MIVDVAQAMLYDQGQPTHLWEEACNTAVYLQNHCPHRVIGMSTPEEAFTSKKPDISHLKILQYISTGLPKGTLAQSDQCKGCIMGKFVKTTFHEKDNRASVILERIHTNMCGPFSVASKEKNRYYVIFVDDYSCRC